MINSLHNYRANNFAVYSQNKKNYFGIAQNTSIPLNKLKTPSVNEIPQAVKDYAKKNCYYLIGTGTVENIQNREKEKVYIGETSFQAACMWYNKVGFINSKGELVGYHQYLPMNDKRELKSLPEKVLQEEEYKKGYIKGIFIQNKQPEIYKGINQLGHDVLLSLSDGKNLNGRIIIERTTMYDREGNERVRKIHEKYGFTPVTEGSTMMYLPAEKIAQKKKELDKSPVLFEKSISYFNL